MNKSMILTSVLNWKGGVPDGLRKLIQPHQS